MKRVSNSTAPNVSNNILYGGLNSMSDIKQQIEIQQSARKVASESFERIFGSTINTKTKKCNNDN